MAASSVGNVRVEFDEDVSDFYSDSEYSSESEGNEAQDAAVEQAQSKKGLADVLAKILHKNVPSHKQVILAKGKTDREIQKRKLVVKASEENEAQPEQKQRKKILVGAELAAEEKRKQWENMCRVKPDPLERDRERQLQRIATRGVVQLFNAVRQQQKTIDDEIYKVGPSERKQEKVMANMTKDKFLSILKGTSSSNVKVDTEQKGSASSMSPLSVSKDTKWAALRDDYMMGAKMKDWDQEGSEGEAAQGEPDMSDSD
ncbi:RRP15-like protein [Dreissena polymorpha]|uniref:RRP15-like protein n=1 Tax=Dreissena polymorpha TaxID=45954 RepID=A0A9D4LAV5_DREPO|nr:RRP15-like protein [Dreissena polymorpha]KAH3854736.1 hypothetical protein DPMN_097285 [Dreissena polymorpha]